VGLDAIFSLKEYRKIRNDPTFSYGNKFYLMDSPLRSSIAKQKIEIRTSSTEKSGVSRQTIYKNRKILKQQGSQALKRTFKENHHHKNRANQIWKIWLSNSR
jgi:hypothetical protein